MTKRKRYKRYSPEFKREALKRAAEEGVTDILVCEELGINPRLLRRNVFKEGIAFVVVAWITMQFDIRKSGLPLDRKRGSMSL